MPSARSSLSDVSRYYRPLLMTEEEKRGDDNT